MKFQFLKDLTSDVMFEAYGKDEKELFENSASALFSVICKTNEVEALKEYEVNLTAENIDELMINWLQELIALVDIEQMFFSKFNVEIVSDKVLKAKIYGEPISPEKGETVVKAVTYYKFKLEQKKDRFVVQVSLDV